MNVNKLFTKARRRLLQAVYGFDKWHISALSERPYAVDIIAYCNKRVQRNNFVEIGCGLGDIIRNVDYRSRTGFDNDEKVLKAARVLRVKNSSNTIIKFETFNFPESKLNGRHDVVTMVNWIHHIEPEILKQKIQQYLNENLETGGEIIIDTVQDTAYRFNHKIDFLANMVNSSVSRIGTYAREREVFSIKKIS
jgi:2-polyprenyl-3-methyl-5-hydroxy-6-metoxy-1,4-benzoquinol methylase